MLGLTLLSLEALGLSDKIDRLADRTDRGLIDLRSFARGVAEEARASALSAAVAAIDKDPRLPASPGSMPVGHVLSIVGPGGRLGWVAPDNGPATPISLANGGFGVDVSTGLTPGRVVRVGSGGAIEIAALAQGDLPLVPKSKGGFGQDVSQGLTADYVAYVDGNGALVIGSLSAQQVQSGTLAWARLPTLNPGVSIPFQTVYTTASRWVSEPGTQYGSTSSGTSTQTSALHLWLPANTTWRLDMVTSYSYGGGGTLRASVLTASAWAGTYAEAAFVTTTSGGVNSVYTTTLAVGASPQVAIFNCRHASNGINNVIMRFYQVG